MCCIHRVRLDACAPELYLQKLNTSSGVHNQEQAQVQAIAYAYTRQNLKYIKTQNNMNRNKRLSKQQENTEHKALQLVCVIGRDEL